MKASLHFILPDDKEDFEDAINGFRYRAILSELDERLRNCLKHGVALVDEKPPPGEAETLEKVRDYLYELLADANLSLY